MFSLVFLLVFTIMGVNSMETALLESRMASSIHQQQSELALAEFTLRKTERDVIDGSVIHGTYRCEELTLDGNDLSVCSLVESLQGESQYDESAQEAFQITVTVTESGTGAISALGSVLVIDCDAGSCLSSRVSWKQGVTDYRELPR